jgi:transposase
MPKPLPEEIRIRVVESYKNGEGSQIKIAKRFKIAPSTLYRWLKREKKSGSLKPDPMGGAHRPFKVNKQGEKIIVDVLDSIPDITLFELSDIYFKETGVRVSHQTMSDTVRRLGYSKKRGVFRGLASFKPDVVKARKTFIEEQYKLDFEKLVFIDEAGVNIGMSRNYGWALLGETPIIERPAKGSHVSLIGAIAFDGTRALRKTKGYIDGGEFINFIVEDLGPNLKNGDIVVMDNLSVHKMESVKKAFEKFGVKVLYLPTYSPELNPIEMTWAWLKNLLRTNPTRKLAHLYQ